MSFILNGAPVSVRATTPTCWPRCARSSTSPRPRTAARRRASAAAARCWSTARPVVSCQLPLDRRWPGKAVTTLEGVDAAERERYADAFAACGGAAVRLLHPRHRHAHQGAGRQEGRRPHPGRHGAATSAPTCAGAPATSRSSTPSRPWPRARCRCRAAGRRRRRGRQVRGRRARRSATGATSTTSACPGMLHAALAPHRPRPGRHPGASTPPRPLAAPGVERRVHRGRHPRRAAGRASSTRTGRCMIPVGGRTSYAGDVLAIVVADDRASGPGARRRWSRSTTTCCPPITDPVAALDRRAETRCGALDGNVLSRSRLRPAATSTPRWPPAAHVVHEMFQTQRIEHAFLEPESTLAVPHADGGARTCTPAARACGTTATRSRACSAVDPSRVTVELVVQRRRLRRQGGHGQPGPDRARRLAARPPGEVHALPRGEPAACTPSATRSACEYRAGCDADGRLTALQGPDGRRLRRLRLRRHEGAGAGRRPRQRAVPRARHRRRGGRRPHQQPGVRRVPGLRRQPGPVRHGGRARPAGRSRSASPAGRSARATSSSPATMWGPGQIMDDGCLGARELPRRDAGPPTTRPSPPARRSALGLGLKNSGLGNGFVEVAKAVVRFDEDGTVEVRHCWTEMGQGVAHRRPAGGGRGARRRPRPRPGRRRHHPRARRRPDHRQPRARSWAPARWPTPAAAAWPTAAGPGVDYEGEYRVDWTHTLGDGRRAPDHPLRRSATPPSSSSSTARRGAVERVVAVHDVGRAVNPLLCEGQIEGAVHMGLGLRADRGLPHRRPRPARPTMTLRQLGILRAKDVPADRGDPGRGAPAPTRRTASRASARSASCPPRGAVAAALHDRRRRVARRGCRCARRQRRRPMSRRDDRHARAGLRPSSPLLGAGPGHARAAGAADRLPRDPRAGLVAARRRARPRDDRAGRPCSAPLEALECGTHGDRRPPRVARTPSRAASTSSPRPAPRSACGWSCAYGVTDRHGAGRRQARAWPRTSASCGPAAGAWSASTPPSRCSRRHARRRPPAWPRDLGVGVHVHVGRGPRRTPAPATGCAPGPATTGCSSTACTSTAAWPGTIAHNPRSNMNNAVGYARPARSGPTRSCSAPTASAPTCWRSSAWPTPPSGPTT